MPTPAAFVKLFVCVANVGIGVEVGTPDVWVDDGKFLGVVGFEPEVVDFGSVELTEVDRLTVGRVDPIDMSAGAAETPMYETPVMA
jgi:hypothetical protein